MRKASGKRNKNASLMVELAAGSLLSLVFVLLALHLGIAIYGAYTNDRACRDACRNAAQGQTLTEATQLAKVILQGYKASSFVGAPSINSAVVYQDYGGNPPAQTSPFVQVTTATKCSMPFGAFSFFNSGPLQDGQLSFVKTYTFPIVRVK